MPGAWSITAPPRGWWGAPKLLLVLALSLALAGTALAETDRVTPVQEDYARNCQGCHRADGMGAFGSVPRLRGFVGLFTQLPEGRDYLIRVPGVVWAMLDDERLTRLMNWLLATYSPEELAPDFRPYSVDEIRRARKRPLADVQQVRARLIVELQRRGLVPPGEDGLVSARRAE